MDVVKYKFENLKSLVGNVAICGRIVSIFDGGELQHKSQQTCNTHTVLQITDLVRTSFYQLLKTFE